VLVLCLNKTLKHGLIFAFTIMIIKMHYCLVDTVTPLNDLISPC